MPFGLLNRTALDVHWEELNINVNSNLPANSKLAFWAWEAFGSIRPGRDENDASNGWSIEGAPFGFDSLYIVEGRNCVFMSETQAKRYSLEHEDSVIVSLATYSNDKPRTGLWPPCVLEWPSKVSVFPNPQEPLDAYTLVVGLSEITKIFDFWDGTEYSPSDGVADAVLKPDFKKNIDGNQLYIHKKESVPWKCRDIQHPASFAG